MTLVAEEAIAAIASEPAKSSSIQRMTEKGATM